MPVMAAWRPARALADHTDRLTSVAIAPDGTWLATASFDKSVRIWDSTTGRQRAVLLGHTKPVMSVAIAPDGTWLADERDRLHAANEHLLAERNQLARERGDLRRKLEAARANLARLTEHRVAELFPNGPGQAPAAAAHQT